MCMCNWVTVHMWMSEWGQFSIPTMCAPGLKLMSLGLATSPLTYGAISLAQYLPFLG